MTPDFIVLSDADAVALAAADRVEQLASEAIAARGIFSVALAGGSTPERLYRFLATRKLPWEKIRWYFSDERFVPHDDPRSNFGMAQRTLLGVAPIARESIFAVQTELATPDAAAASYCAQVPDRIDLVLLGLGDDGHTASLFPGKAALSAQTTVTASEPGVLPPSVDRVTFTFPTINAARNVLFLVTGANKAQKVADWRAGVGSITTLPVLGVQPTDGTLTILLDQAAAGAAA